MKRSKQYFKNARPKETWANIEEESSPAIRTRTIMMKIMKPRNKICLSLACGWGRFLQDYLKNKAEMVIGADISKENLVKCQKIGADVVLCDIENWPFRDNLIDAMECVATMEHLAHPEKVVKEMSRIINETDGVAFITWNHYNWAKALFDRETRHRLILRVRDLFCDTLPHHVGRRVLTFKLLSPFLKDFGLYRNSGFSFSTILRIYADASMRIILAKWLTEENIIVVASVSTGCDKPPLRFKNAKGRDHF